MAPLSSPAHNTRPVGSKARAITLPVILLIPPWKTKFNVFPQNNFYYNTGNLKAYGIGESCINQKLNLLSLSLSLSPFISQYDTVEVLSGYKTILSFLSPLAFKHTCMNILARLSHQTVAFSLTTSGTSFLLRSDKTHIALGPSQ